MKARVKGCNDTYKEIQSINVDGEFYPPEVLEFEEEQVCAKNAHTANDGKVYMSEAFIRNQAAIAAMQSLISNESYMDYLMRKLNDNEEDAEAAFFNIISDDAIFFADALIKKLKGE